MAKIKPMALIENMSGKVCVHSDVSFRTNKVTGKVSSSKLCNPFKGPFSNEQVAAQNRFKTVVAAIRARIAALPTADKTALVKEYKAQHEVGSLFGYCMKKWNNEYDASGALIGD